MHVVYFIEFGSRKEKNLMPYYYIGSKSNCKFDGKNIIDKNGNKYFGSSNYKDYNEIVKNESKLSITILGIYDNYDECLQCERDVQIQNDVVIDPRYFNLGIATISNYTFPDYATVKHKITGKCIRIPKDHPKILDGTYVGVTSGYRWINNGSEIKTIGEDEEIPNGWELGHIKGYFKSKGFVNYWSTHEIPEEISRKQIASRKKMYKENPERYKLAMEKIIEGSRKFTCNSIWVNNGVDQKRINKNEDIPDGFVKGRLPLTEEHKQKLRETSGNRKWITNGTKGRMIKSYEKLPDGWWYGQPKKE